jgi:hypothetical protein
MLTTEDRKRRRARKLNTLRGQLFEAIDAVLDAAGCEGTAACAACKLRRLADEYQANTRTGPGYGRRRRAGRARR